jgi:signal peptidase I
LGLVLQSLLVIAMGQLGQPGSIPQDMMKLALGQEYEWVWEDGGQISTWRIPANSMAPTLMDGDRVLAVTADAPRRGDIWVFKHPGSDRNMVSRVIGLPGDEVQVSRGRLILNGTIVERRLVREVAYWDERRIQEATEYTEQLPGEAAPHLIHEFSEQDSLDETPVFIVPRGKLFFMGDNRDNSEDSRAPSGHRALFAELLSGWKYRPPTLPADPRDDAIGFVPFENLLGRVATVVLSTRSCPVSRPSQTPAVECLPAPIGKRL